MEKDSVIGIKRQLSSICSATNPSSLQNQKQPETPFVRFRLLFAFQAAYIVLTKA